MSRSLRRNRWGFTRLLAVLATVAGILFVAAVPAWAHHPVLSGSTSCPDENHLVTWTIGNSESAQVMTINSAIAELNGTTYAVTGYSTTVVGGGSTTGTTIVPGNLTGTITLTVNADWTDRFNTTRTTSVALEFPCNETTTTTTVPEETTTTTAPEETTTTTVAETTTTTAPEETTTTTAPEETTTSGPVVTIETTTTTGGGGTDLTGGSGGTPPGELPHTGMSSVERKVLLALLLLTLGTLLAVQKPKTRYSRG